MDADAPAHSVDGFLGGRIQVRQPVHGYRAGIDPVLLAAAVPARAGESVLELGCGVGTALLCLAARVPGLELTGLEVQGDYARLARDNAERNGIAMEIHQGTISDPPAALKARSFDHVILNPPFFLAKQRTAAENTGREIALTETDSLAVWCDAAMRRLKPGGVLSLIHLPERLPDLLVAVASRSSTTVYPIAPRQGRAAHRILLSARKGGKAALKLAAPSILHKGMHHERDGEDYAPEIVAILRNGAPWPWNSR